MYQVQLDGKLKSYVIYTNDSYRQGWEHTKCGRDFPVEKGNSSAEGKPMKIWQLESVLDSEFEDLHLKELAALIGVPQPPEHHPEGDTFEHSMQVPGRQPDGKG